MSYIVNIKVRYVFLICFGCITASTFCQKQKSLPPPPLPSEPKKIGGTKFSLQKRLSFYPFNKATQIKLVSFTQRSDTSGMHDEQIWGLPIINDTICFSMLEEVKTISLKQVDTLTDILYNTCYRWNMTTHSVAACYFPRNAIIFFDENDKSFEYIELCFECHGLKYSNKKIEESFLCDDWYDGLQEFFAKLGLKTSAAELLNKN